MKSTTLACAIALFAVLLPATARAVSNEQQFATTAGQGTLMQLVLSELAAQRALSESVRRYAMQAADDCRTLKSRIERTAEASHVQIALAPSREQQETAEALLTLVDEEFEVRFAEVARTELDDLLSTLRSEYESAGDTPFKSLAEEYVPVLERRLAALDSLQARTASIAAD